MVLSLSFKSSLTLTFVALLAELRAKDYGKGKRVYLDTLWRFLKGCGFSFKKTICAAEKDRPDVARRRYWWRKYQTRIEPSRLVFIEETPAFARAGYGSRQT